MPNKPEEASFKDIVKHLTDYYDKSSVVWVERAKFYSAHKEENETVQEWSVRLKSLAKCCKFGDALDSKLTDIFITRFNAGKIKKNLFSEKGNITFEQVIEKAKIEEASQRGIREAEADIQKEYVKEEMVHRVSHGGKVRSNSQQPMYSRSSEVASTSGARNRNFQQPARQPSAPSQRSRNYDKAQVNGGARCQRCGRNHTSNLCPYKDYTCHACQSRGHLQAVCKKPKHLNYLGQDQEEELDEETSPVFCIKSADCDNPLYIDILIEGKMFEFELDSGSAISILPRKIFNEFLRDTH